MDHTDLTGGSPSPERESRIHEDNLFKVPSHRMKEMTENQKRVQRLKLEKKFMAEVAQGKHYKLGDYHRLQEDELLKAPKKPLLTPPRSVKRRHPEPKKEPIRVVHEFSGSIRCLELTQGGATLWTGDNDGTISIRNGMTGEIVHHIPSSGGLYVDSLYATDTHMWVGMNDGTVRIYDHLVYILVSEAQFHEGSVTCFTSTFDGKVFSASADSIMVKWDTEANNFALMTKLRGPSSEMIRCMACYGYNLFCAGDDKIIRCLDTEAGSGQEVRNFIGHTGAVNALLVQDGYLFSASMDGTIRVWNMEHYECIWVMGSAENVTHGCPVTSLIGDTVAHRFWSADISGIIHVWESSPENDFKHVQALKDHEGPRIISMRNFCTIDAVKLWSLAANGKNRVWYSAVNKVEDAVQSTIDAMENIITQDMVELSKWKDLITKLEAIDERRKTELAAALGSTSSWGLQRTYLQKWQRFVAVSHAKKRRENIASMLMAGTEKGLMLLYFQKLEKFYVEGKSLRRKKAMALGLMAQNTRALQQLYWRKLKAYTHLQKRAIQNRQMAETMLCHSEEGTRRAFYRRWLRYHDAVCRRAKRNQVAENLQRMGTRGVMHIYFTKLRNYRMFKKQQAKRLRAAEMLLGGCDRGVMRVHYRKLALYAQMMSRKKKRGKYATALEERTDAGLRSRYYTKLSDYYKMRSKEKLKQKLADEEARKKRLEKEFEEKQALLARVRLVTEKKKEIQEALEKKEEAEKRKQAALDELRKLEDMLERKKQGALERQEKAKSEMVEDVMAMLKAKCLNYHLDFALIQKTRDQCKQLPVTKIFLEAHMSIKRVIIDITKFNQVSGQRWKGLDKVIDNIPDYHKSTILNSVKTMIICFDIMDEATKDSLETDDEILANTEYLEQLVTIAVRHRDQKLGRAAFRVK